MYIPLAKYDILNIRKGVNVIARKKTTTATPDGATPAASQTAEQTRHAKYKYMTPIEADVREYLQWIHTESSVPIARLVNNILRAYFDNYLAIRGADDGAVSVPVPRTKKRLPRPPATTTNE
jgi:hypothetical protein